MKISFLTCMLFTTGLYAQNMERSIYDSNIKACQAQTETSLLENPSFNGTTLDAMVRSEIACRNRFGVPPEKYHAYEQEYIDKLSKIILGKWQWDELITEASRAAEKHKAGLFNFSKTKSVETQVKVLTEALVIYGKACDYKDNEKMTFCYKKVSEATNEFVKKYNAAN